MLRPAVQPGSTTGYTLPDEEVSLAFSASRPIELTTPAGTASSGASGPGPYRVRGFAEAQGTTAAWRLKSLWRPARQTTLEVGLTPLMKITAPVHFLSGGSYCRGRLLKDLSRQSLNARFPNWGVVTGPGGVPCFSASESKCADVPPGSRARWSRSALTSQISSIAITPPWSAISNRLAPPSIRITSLTTSHLLMDASFRDTLSTEGDRLIVGDTNGRQTIVARGEVETTSPSSTSIMPEGLDRSLGQEKLRDLLTFLLTEPLAAVAVDQNGAAPPPRRRSELAAVLKGGVAVEKPKKLRLVLAAGPKDHGPGEHDYPLWLKRWSALFATDKTVDVRDCTRMAGRQTARGGRRGRFLFQQPGLGRGQGRRARSVLCQGRWRCLDPLRRRRARGSPSPRKPYRPGVARRKVRISPRPARALTSHGQITRSPASFEKLELLDESYWNLVGNPASIDVLGTGIEDGQPRPLFWTRQAGKGRVFVSIPGHFTWTFDDPLFRLLILRGVAWTAGEPVDRFNELATLGARIAE